MSHNTDLEGQQKRRDITNGCISTPPRYPMDGLQLRLGTRPRWLERKMP